MISSLTRRMRGPDSKGPRVGVRTVVVLAALTLAMAGVTAWALQREDPALSTLRSDLDQAKSDLSAARSDLNAAQQDVEVARAQAEQDSRRIAKLRKRLAQSLSTDGLPTLELIPPANHPRAKLYRELESQLVAPMVKFFESHGDHVIAVVVDVPEKQGDPFTYTAITTLFPQYADDYGAKGQPLPTWKPECTPDGCAGYH